ncbi:MAG: TolB-like protein [Paraglaciecola sp.]|jgi:TolB-like protein
MRNLFLIVFCGLSISACTTSRQSHSDKPTQIHHQQDALHRQVENLARQLFSTSQTIDITQTVAIGTILPAFTSSGGTLPLDSALGVQIQESLMTFATQAGMKVIEYKTMPAIKIGQQADEMLSRDISELNNNISADYFLTGTYTTQEDSTMINIRLIQVPDNIVLAAATDYVPNDIMWSRSKVSLKNNQIYRNEY